MSEWVKPNPGPAAVELRGVVGLQLEAGERDPYTNHLERRSGAYEPTSSGTNATRFPSSFWMT